MRISIYFFFVTLLATCVTAFNLGGLSSRTIRSSTTMKVENDAFTRANRATRAGGADDRMVEVIIWVA